MRKALIEDSRIENFNKYKYMNMTPELLIDAINHWYNTIDTYVRNEPHTYPDLLNQLDLENSIEIKTSLGSNLLKVIILKKNIIWYLDIVYHIKTVER